MLERAPIFSNPDARRRVIFHVAPLTARVFPCVLGGQSQSQRQQLPAEGRLLQARAEGLAGLQRGGEAAHQQAAVQVS